jgi:hypothetical protein
VLKRATSKQYRTVEQLARECLGAAHGNRERAIALGRRRLREIYLAQIKKAKSDYFDRVKRAADRHALLRTSPARANREGANG